MHVQINGTATLMLANAAGKVVLSKRITNSGDINIAHLPVGVYYLKNGNTNESKKVLIQK